jgi:hypothetical protein
MSWDILSRPYGTGPGAMTYPGLRPGLLSASLVQIRFFRRRRKPARLRLGFLPENRSQLGGFHHEWSMQYFFADFGGIFSGRV